MTIIFILRPDQLDVWMNSTHRQFRERLKGANVLLTTPFTEDGNVDETALREKVRFLQDNGLSKSNGSLVVLGSVGECSTLTTAEQERTIEAVVDVADEIPVVAGANHSGTQVATEMANRALSLGADAVMSVTPYYYPPSAESVQRHYEQLAEGVDGPIVLYNNFVVSDIDVPLDVLVSLSRRDEFVAIKEPTLNTAKFGRLVEEVGDEIAVLNGNGERFEPQCYLLGSVGITTAVANYAPELSFETVRLGKAGAYDELREVTAQLAPVFDVFDTLAPEHAPAALKHLETCFDAPGGGPVRTPHPPLPKEKRRELTAAAASLTD